MTNFKRFSLAALVVFVALTLSGCAGIMTKIPTEDELGGIRGMSKEAVLQKLGKPTDKSKNGNVWYYKKPTNNLINNMVLICSFGLWGGKNSAYMDVAKVTFKNGRVYATETMEENLNLGGSSFGLANDFVSDLNHPQGDSEDPAEIKTKGIVKKAANDLGLDSTIPEPSTPAVSTAEPERKTEPRAASRSNSGFRQANLFSECSLKDAKKRVCANAKKLGFAIEQKKDGRVNLTRRDGTKITSSFKKVGKDVVVELTSKQEAADDMQQILE